MPNTIKPARLSLRVPLFFVLILILTASISFGQDYENSSAQESGISASINFERLSISYNGISDSTRLRFHSNLKPYPLGSQKLHSTSVENVDAANDAFVKFGGKLWQITHYFFRYFNVDDISTDTAGSTVLLKSKTDPDMMRSNDFDFNVSVNIGYESGTALKMNAVKLESCWHYTYVNAIYHYEKRQVELGLSSAVLNSYLFDGMRLEIQANPAAGSGAIVLSMGI